MEGSCTEEDPLRRFGPYMSGGPPDREAHHCVSTSTQVLTTYTQAFTSAALSH